MIEKITNQNQIARHKLAEKINELVDIINTITIDVDGTKCVDGSKNVADRMIGCTILDILKSYKNDQLTLATLDYSKKLEKENSDLKDELELTRKENEDKQAVLNCVVDMLKTLNQKYTLIMGKDVIKETVRLLEQTKGCNNE